MTPVRFFTFGAAVLVAASCGAHAAAQGVFKFKLEPGMKLQYESTFEQKVETKVGAEVSTSKTILTQLRQWHVQSVDALGVATMELTVLRMKLKRNDPDGKELVYDSASPVASDPQLAEQLSKAVGKPILRVQLASNGVVKASQGLGDAKTLFPELPFQVSVPDEYPRRGLKWRREFAIALPPPLGKDEAFKAVQDCTVSNLDDAQMVVEAETRLDAEPPKVTAQIALNQFLPKGKVTLDVRRGVMLKSEMAISKKIDNVDGENSTYVYSSTAVEKLVDTSVEQARKD